MSVKKHDNQPLLDALNEQLSACCELDNRGCWILNTQMKANQDGYRPIVKIAPPPGSAYLRGSKTGMRLSSTVYSARLGIVEIEWDVMD